MLLFHHLIGYATSRYTGLDEIQEYFKRSQIECMVPLHLHVPLVKEPNAL